MKNMRQRIRLGSATLTVGLAVAGALALPAGPVVAQQSGFGSTIQLGQTAQLVARGAAVIVPVTVTCEAGATIFYIQVDVAQRAGGRINRGTGFFQGGAQCTGLPESFNIFVTAQARPFRKGVASASAFFSSGSGTSSDAREIKIVS